MGLEKETQNSDSIENSSHYSVNNTLIGVCLKILLNDSFLCNVYNSIGRMIVSREKSHHN